MLLAVLLSTLAAITPLRAHEVQPGIMDVTILPDRLDIRIDWMIEAAVAGLDLAEVADTSEAANDGEYDRLRALPPEALAAEVRADWPVIADKITIAAGDRRLPLALGDVTVPEVGNIELARVSVLTLTAPLPPNDAPLTIGWDAELGPLVVRQVGVEDGYAAYLQQADGAGGFRRLHRGGL